MHDTWPAVLSENYDTRKFLYKVLSKIDVFKIKKDTVRKMGIKHVRGGYKISIYHTAYFVQHEPRTIR